MPSREAMRRWVLGASAAVAVALALAPHVSRSFAVELGRQSETDGGVAIARARSLADWEPSYVTGLDLTKISLEGGTATAPLEGGKRAKLSLDPHLQRAALERMRLHHIPEAVVVLMDASTGQLVVYASHVSDGPARDLAVEATAPAASVFKIVTGAALVETAGLTPETRQCYSGGEQRIHASDLEDSPKRDRWCTTLAGAMGRSTNTVFARLALRHLKPAALETLAKALGFAQAIPFDVPVHPSELHLPEPPLEFARTAAGFWNTTLSPVHAALLSAAVARQGEMPRPSIVTEIVDSSGATKWKAGAPRTWRRALEGPTAEALATMLERTVSDGTSYRAFHDANGTPFLPGIQVAGKTGTLTDDKAQRYYTWFTGFAPSRPIPNVEVRTVAIAVLVVNRPTWHVKANVLAREVLHEYFAQHKVPSVLRPLPTARPRPGGSHGLGASHAR